MAFDFSSSKPGPPQNENSRGLTITIVVPTLDRIDFLERCLDSIKQQTHVPDEIVVATHEWDSTTAAYLRSAAPFPCPIRQSVTREKGVIANMQAAINITKSNVVALLDDDVTLHPNWIEKVLCHFESQPRPSGVGGKDFLQDDPAGRQIEPLTRRVGVFAWTGHLSGNHHRGTGPPREVDVLKGCNCAYDGVLLRRIGLDHSLRGSGAQVGWELSLAFDIKKTGGRLVYDPSIQVDHWIAPRHDESLLNRTSTQTVEFQHMIYNGFCIMRRKAKLHHYWGHVTHALLWGNRSACGAIRSVLLVLSGDQDAWRRFAVVFHCWVESVRTTHRPARSTAPTT